MSKIESIDDYNGSLADETNTYHTITIDDVAKYMYYSIINNVSAFFFSSPGIGKSVQIRSIAKALGYHLEDIRLASYDVIDLRGLPTKGYMDYSLRMNDKNQIIDENGDVIYGVNSEGAMVEWAMPDFLVRAREARLKYGKPTIFFFDEMNHADHEKQCPANQFILEKQIGCFKFHEDDRTFAAGNFESDLAFTNELSLSLANRFSHFFVRPDADCFVRYARSNNFFPALIAYVDKTKNIYDENFAERTEASNNKAFLSPRSLEFCSNDCYLLLENLNKEMDILNEKLSKEKNPEIRAFLKDLIKSLPKSIDEKYDDLLISLSGKIGLGDAEELLTYIRVGQNVPAPDKICSGYFNKFKDTNIKDLKAEKELQYLISKENIDVQFVATSQCVSYLLREYEKLEKECFKLTKDFFIPGSMEERSDFECSDENFKKAFELGKDFATKLDNYIVFLRDIINEKDLILSSVIVTLIRDKEVVLLSEHMPNSFNYIHDLLLETTQGIHNV